MKLYIMGSTGSGKSTLAKALSKRYNIDYYELDKLVYYRDDITKHRPDNEIEKDFNSGMLKKDIVTKHHITLNQLNYQIRKNNYEK